MSSSNKQPLLSPTAPSLTSLPVRPIPGGPGLPLVGPLWDRLHYFWFQGEDKYFREKMKKNKSTVFRTNMPPSFPSGANTNIIVTLDFKSFSHLFDFELVDRRDALGGNYVPNLNFTGGVKVCGYLDTTDPQHAKTKNFLLDILKRSSTIWVPTFVSKLDIMWDTIESTLSKSGSASYKDPLNQFIFSFLTRCLIGADTASSPEIAESGYSMLAKWGLFQLLPITPTDLIPQPFQEIFLHSFPLPFALVRSGYNKLIEFVEKEGKEVIERGQTEFKLSHQETIHNLLFMLGLNAFAGFAKYLPNLLKTLASDKTGLQEKLRKEVRQNSGSTLSFDSVKGMELVQSFVYETLRFKPPVERQYARARKDFQLSSHDSAYEIKKGELLCGYQPLAMRDPKVFNDPETFDPYRFTGESGRKLLRFVYWSGGPETGSPSESNKQCVAKDYVTPSACLFVAHVLLRYDSITCNSSGSITSLEKAK